MATSFRVLTCAASLSWALAGPACATGSAIQQERSTAGLSTVGPTRAGTGGTGIYSRAQRRMSGHGPARDRVAPPR